MSVAPPDSAPAPAPAPVPVTAPPAAVHKDVPTAKEVKWLRIAVVLVLLGIVSELLALLSLTPPTFLTFVFIGLPCMGLGVLIYAVHVWKQLRKKDVI